MKELFKGISYWEMDHLAPAQYKGDSDKILVIKVKNPLFGSEIWYYLDVCST